MTAFTAARTSADQGAERKRPRKAVAFGLAGLIAAAGIAGAVVTSSAYFTDTKTVANNSVATYTIKLDPRTSAGAAMTTGAAVGAVVPATVDNVETLAKSQEFQIYNAGDGAFTWAINFESFDVKRGDGVTLLPTSTGTDRVTIDEARAKLRYQIGYIDSAGATQWSTVFSAAKSVSVTDVAPDEFTSTRASELVSGDATAKNAVKNLAKEGVAKIKVRYWLNSDANDNKAQDVKYTFNLRFDAVQSL